MAHWRDGTDVNGDHVAQSLNRAVAADSRNPFKPLLSAVDTVVGMTGRVVEIRLRTPRPNLLQLLAQPEMAIQRGRQGLGDFRIAHFTRNRVQLTPIAAEDDPPDQVRGPVLLRAERPALAIARFVANRSDLVMEGTLADWPYVRTATLRPGRLHIDAVQGLFGLAVIGKSSFLGTSDVRAALAMAIDRTALANAVGLSGWVTAESPLPAQLDSAAPPTRPDWSGASQVQRRADAAARIAAWRNGRQMPVLRVGLPTGPGMRLMFARLDADWRLIGVRAKRVTLNAPDADLRLIDAVAPNSSANWYLTELSCAAGLACDGEADRALDASRSADTLADRSVQIADADRVLTKRASFISAALVAGRSVTTGMEGKRARRPPAFRIASTPKRSELGERKPEFARAVPNDAKFSRPRRSMSTATPRWARSAVWRWKTSLKPLSRRRSAQHRA